MAVKEVKLCLLGESGVGKSSIAVRFVHDNFRPTMEATIGASFLTKTMHVEGRSFKFQIWDTAGQEKYRALAPMYYRGAQAAIIVYDITKEDSFKTLRSWVHELQRHGAPNIVLAIAGNKADLEDLREVRHKDALDYAEGIGAVLVETSAKSAININVLFHEICKRLSTDDFESTTPDKTIKVNKGQNGEKKKGCC